MHACLIAQSSNPMDYSPPGSPIREILQARILEWMVIPSLQGIFPTQGLNPSLLSLRDWRDYH